MSGAATVLDDILTRKRRDLAARTEAMPLAMVQAQAEATPPPRGFAAALRRGRRRALDGRTSPALIAEIKRASPSKGLIRSDFDPPILARQYRHGGASALSVLTDEPYFQGRPEYLTQAREASGLPVLRKDFMLEPYQVYEARALGADAVLLIVAALGRGGLRPLVELTAALGMDALVEVHDRAELEVALEAGAQLIGVNNRDLRTFHTDLQVTEELAARVPAGCLVVSESGISSRQDLLRVAAAGAGAALVGESLMRQEDVAEATSRLLGSFPGPTGPWTKICGHTRPESVQAAVEAGASAVGFVFARSRRQVSPDQARELGQAVPPWAERIGVFAEPEAGGSAAIPGVAVTGSAWLAEVAATAEQANLTGVQLHGCRNPEMVKQARRLLPLDLRLLVGVAVRDRTDLAPLAAMAAAGADAILLDTLVPGRSGGTGRSFDWSLVPLARQQTGPRVPLYLAGGLTPDNARSAWAVSGADGLDVSSGVETDGVKDAAKIRAFLEALRGDER